MERTDAIEKFEEPTLSACMIVKDEEKFLPQCLESIKDVVDEIIIVDTGSTDRTVKIAESYGAKVYHHPWNGSFSEARNHSLKYATHDWILQIDADEKLESKDVPMLRAALRQGDYNALFVALISEMPTGLSKSYFQRIHRRGKAHYEGIVHNQVVCEGKSLLTEIRFYHYGYNLDPEKMAKKYKRTEDLLRKQIAEKPDYLFARANLVRTYRSQGLWDDTIDAAEDALKLDLQNEDPTAYQMILCDITYAYLRKGDYEKGIQRCSELLESCPNSLDGQFYMGGLLICTRDYEKAIKHYGKYIELLDKGNARSSFNALIVDTYGSQAQAWNNIGSSYLELGQLDEAILAFQKALSYDDKTSLYHENLVRAFLKQNRSDKALKALEYAANREAANSGMYFQMGSIYNMQGDIDRAAEYLRKALNMDKSNVRYYVGLSEILISQGNAGDAESLLSEAIKLDPEQPEILNNLARVSVLLEKDEAASEYIDRLMKLINLSGDLYMKLGNDWFNINGYDQAILFYERCLISDPGNYSALTNMATCYARLGQYESAITGYRAALAINPNDPAIIANLLILKRDIEASFRK